MLNVIFKKYKKCKGQTDNKQTQRLCIPPPLDPIDPFAGLDGNCWDNGDSIVAIFVIGLFFFLSLLSFGTLKRGCAFWEQNLKPIGKVRDNKLIKSETSKLFLVF